MALFARTYDQLMGDSLDDLSTNTQISRLAPGGLARALLESVNRRVSKAYETFDTNLARAFLSAAKGQYLDLIGMLLNVQRGAEGAANVSSTEQTIKFYVNSGTFGDINSDNNITLPQGTLISTEASNSGTVYRTTEEITLSKTASFGYVSAEAVIPGEASNIGSGSLGYHNFINYTDNSNDTLLVTNIYPISNGLNFENDDNYRYRIANKALEGEAANQTAIRLAVLSTVGVADAILIPRYRGIGTVGIILKSVSPTVSTTLIDNVRANVSIVQAYGDISYILGPKETGVTMRLTIHYDSKLSDEDLAIIESDIQTTLTNDINALDIGEGLIVNRLISRLFTLSPHITNIGEYGKPVDELAIYTVSKLQDNKVRKLLLGDYYPQYDERVIIETSVSNPIVLVRAYDRR